MNFGLITENGREREESVSNDSDPSSRLPDAFRINFTQFDNIDRPGHCTSGQTVDYAIVSQFDFESEPLQTPSDTPRSTLSVILTGNTQQCTHACDTTTHIPRYTHTLSFQLLSLCPTTRDWLSSRDCESSSGPSARAVKRKKNGVDRCSST